MSTPFAVFGPGILIATRTDTTVPAAVNVGFVQEFSIDSAATNKSLYGQKQYPLLSARGTVKATGSMKNATVSGYAMNVLFYGESGSSTTTGALTWITDSTWTASTALVVGSSLITGSSSFSADFEGDLGVRGSTSNLPYIRVATGSEVSGVSYSVTTAAGIATYAFASGDTTALKITFTASRTTGVALIATNHLIGTTPTFQLDYWTSVNQPSAKPFIVRIYNAIAEKHTMAFKLEDFMIPEFNFNLFANASDQVYDFVFPERS